MKPFVYRYNSSSSLGVAFNAAYADVAGISPWTAAGSVMRFKGFFTYTVSAATVGLIPALNGPAVTMYSGRFSVQTAADGTNTQKLHSGYRPSAIVGVNGAVSATTYAIIFDGMFIVGSSGGGLTVSFKGSGTAGTATVASGGTLLVEQLL